MRRGQDEYNPVSLLQSPENKVTIFRWVDVATYQDTEERCEEKFSRPVLEQREAERSAYRLWLILDSGVLFEE